jgi:ribosomal protein S5
MKKLIILVVSILLSASTIHATEIPDAVKTAFQQKFPTVKKVKWEKEKTNEYEASFMLDNKEVSVLYLPDGKLKEIETEISVSELPKAVKEAINKKHPNAKIDEAAKIERSDNSIVYEAEVKIGGKKTDLLFDEKGNIVN